VEVAANVRNRNLPLFVELAGKGDVAGVVGKFWPSSLSPPRSGSLDACLGSLPKPEGLVSGRKSGADMARLCGVRQPTVSRIVAAHLAGQA
jgi:hypothetical protein